MGIQLKMILNVSTWELGVPVHRQSPAPPAALGLVAGTGTTTLLFILLRFLCQFVSTETLSLCLGWPNLFKFLVNLVLKLIGKCFHFYNMLLKVKVNVKFTIPVFKQRNGGNPCLDVSLPLLHRICNSCCDRCPYIFPLSFSMRRWNSPSEFSLTDQHNIPQNLNK